MSAEKTNRGNVKLKVAIVTSSRADYSHLYWVLVELSKRSMLEVALVTMSSHLSPEFGNTGLEIARDGFSPAVKIECLLSSDTDIGMAKTIGLATLSLADYLGASRPDLLLLIADRYEMLAPASVALALRIPVAHIEGGDVSLGAIDEAVRNALTKLSHVHLTTTENARRRVISMGEEPWRVHVVGSPSLDHITKGLLLSREEIQSRLQLPLKEETIAVIYHPLTLSHDTLCEAGALFAALEDVPQDLLIISPNADAGSRELLQRISAFRARKPNVRFITSIEHRTYLSLLQFLALLVGNSSSGIMESASFKLPTVNVGKRQDGRETGRNVLHCAADENDIRRAIRTALSPHFRSSLDGLQNPYGDGHSAEKIADIISSIGATDALLAKAPVPLPLGIPAA
jgi:UDP-N-acetylglucosamine 2-epimerase (non-hydrolysing)/GDP/UDP-N,N'-diacetylbacillosamine 2-epimerase (hydrolysing)